MIILLFCALVTATITNGILPKSKSESIIQLPHSMDHYEKHYVEACQDLNVLSNFKNAIKFLVKEYGTKTHHQIFLSSNIWFNYFYEHLHKAIKKHPTSQTIDKILNDEALIEITRKFDSDFISVVKTFVREERKSVIQSGNAQLFPIRLSYDSGDLIISKMIGSGSGGTAYDCYFESNPSDPLIVKFYAKKSNPEESKKFQTQFDRELNALKILNRLVMFDSGHLMLVFHKIKGETLHNLIYEKYGTGDAPFEKYKSIAKDFYEQTGLIHGDIHPGNIIVDDDNNLHLIDFGFSFKPNEIDANEILEKDQKRANKDYDLSILHSRGVYALQHPTDSESKQKIKDLVFELSERNHSQLWIWAKKYHDLYGENVF